MKKTVNSSNKSLHKKKIRQEKFKKLAAKLKSNIVKRKQIKSDN